MRSINKVLLFNQNVIKETSFFMNYFKKELLIGNSVPKIQSSIIKNFKTKIKLLTPQAKRKMPVSHNPIDGSTKIRWSNSKD